MPEKLLRLALCDAMTLAAMADRKTQTRRLLNPQPPDHLADLAPSVMGDVALWLDADGNRFEARARYAVGDRVALTEAFRVIGRCLGKPPGSEMCGPFATVEYRCDGQHRTLRVPKSHNGKPASRPRDTWLAARFMPLWAARPGNERIITRVRCERVQDITEADAIAEGVAAHCGGFLDYELGPGIIHAVPARYSFQTLWNKLHGAGAWDRNEWVFAYSFKREEAESDGL